MKELSESGDLISIRFSIPGQPFGKQRPRVIHTGAYSRAYTPKETVNYENLVRTMFLEAAGGHRFRDEDMLDVRIIAYFSIPRSVSMKRRKLMLEHKIRPTRKPDVDNLSKVVYDSMTGVAYHDDSSIVDSQTRKFYSEKPRVDVTIRKVEQ